MTDRIQPTIGQHDGIWRLYYPVPESDTAYELRVRHWAIEDSITFWSLDPAARDDQQLLTAAEWADHLEALMEHSDHARTRSAAMDEAHAQGVRQMSQSVEEIRHQMLDHWMAFRTLFRPSIT